MRKLLLGALAAAGLVFAGCQRDVPGTSDDGMGGAGTGGADSYEPSLHPTPSGVGGAGEVEEPVRDEPVLEDPELYEQDELQNEQDATGGSGLQEDEMDLQGIDGSGRESTMQDHDVNEPRR